ncbi:MAG: hypothetical protein U0236_16245 [Nitrospira sp.]
MESARDLINARIAWCQRQREQASTESEVDGWRAEEDGLRDALLNKNYTDAYRLSTAEAFRRYVQGLRDGKALLRMAHAVYVLPDVVRAIPCPGDVCGMGVSTKRNNGVSTIQRRRSHNDSSAP